MVKKIFLGLLLMPSLCMAQNAEAIIKHVKATQKSISVLSYDLSRTDTIGTYIRHMKGHAIVEKNDIDTIFGFKFWAKKIGDPIETMYDGRVGYSIDSSKRNYEIATKPEGFENLLNGGGGHMIVPGIMDIEKLGYTKLALLEDDKTYLLTFHYPDIVEYDISNKFRAVLIDKKTMLPLSIREHQESLGRIQDLYYEISNLQVNAASQTYNFIEPSFLKNYAHVIPVRKPSPVMDYLGSVLPDFKLQTFINGNQWVSSTEFKGKVILLDFWEVWCSPCIAAMPNVEVLYDKYKTKGLLIYGIVNDSENTTSSKIFATKKGFTLPTLMGSEQLKTKLKITGIPLYILIDRTGKVSFISEGYSSDIEGAIIKALER